MGLQSVENLSSHSRILASIGKVRQAASGDVTEQLAEDVAAVYFSTVSAVLKRGVEIDDASERADANTCAVYACAPMVAIVPLMAMLASPVTASPDFLLRNHAGCLLAGPDPYPPRLPHA